MHPVSTEPDKRMDEITAIRFARQKGLTLNELSDILVTDLCRGLPTDVVDLALRILHATQRLLGLPY